MRSLTIGCRKGVCMENNEKSVKLGKEDLETVSGGTDDIPSDARKPLYEIGEEVYLVDATTPRLLDVTIFDRYWYLADWYYKMSGDTTYTAPEGAIYGRVN